MNDFSSLQPVELLLVEDSPSDANLMIREFQQTKILNHVTWIEQGEAAMAYLRQQDEYVGAALPDLILLDLNLPGMDGREVLEEIKSDPALQHIPVIILTTSNDEQDILRSYDLNANCYVTKPVEIQEFIRVIQLLEEFWLAAVRLPSA